jgi:serine/threonine-protein kinase RsbW
MPDAPDQQDLPKASSPDVQSPMAARILLTNRPDDIESLRQKLLKAIDASGYPQAAAFAIRLAFDEAVSNAFKHGHRTLASVEPVVVSFDVDPRCVKIVVSDRGPGFEPEGVPDPTLDENLSRPSGRGIMLMKAYMTVVSYNERGNEVTLVYERPEG